MEERGQAIIWQIRRLEAVLESSLVGELTFSGPDERAAENASATGVIDDWEGDDIGDVGGPGMQHGGDGHIAGSATM